MIDSLVLFDLSHIKRTKDGHVDRTLRATGVGENESKIRKRVP